MTVLKDREFQDKATLPRVITGEARVKELMRFTPVQKRSLTGGILDLYSRFDVDIEDPTGQTEDFRRPKTRAEFSQFITMRLHILVQALKAYMPGLTNHDIREYLCPTISPNTFATWLSGQAQLPAWAALKLCTMSSNDVLGKDLPKMDGFHNYSWWDTTGRMNTPLCPVLRLSADDPRVNEIYYAITKQNKFDDTSVEVRRRSKVFTAKNMRTMTPAEINAEICQRINDVLSRMKSAGLKIPQSELARRIGLNEKTFNRVLAHNNGDSVRGHLKTVDCILINHHLMIPRKLIWSEHEVGTTQILISHRYRQMQEEGREAEAHAIFDAILNS